ncbi:MAG: carboxypeptidase-like regulatory domain-containing protein [Planctomycetaceae bacterium]
MKFKSVAFCRVLLPAIVGLALLPIVGCGGANDRLETSPVSGTVTVDGAPVAGASVNFHPVSETKSREAYGITNDQGEFSLTTYDDGDGAVPGTYLISITKREVKKGLDPSTLTPSGPDNPGSAEYAKMMIGNNRESAFEDTGAVPAQYQDKESSGLKRTVDAGGGNVFNFELKKEAAPEKN